MHFAIVTIFFISLVDAFFLSAFFLYGMLVFGTAGALYAGGYISAIEMFWGAYLGSTLGSTLNFYAGRWFSHSRYVQRFTEHRHTMRIKRLLTESGLLLTIVLGKFLGPTRPLYGVVLGALRVNPHRFLLIEWIIGALWTLFWVVVLTMGTAAFGSLSQWF